MIIFIEVTKNCQQFQLGLSYVNFQENISWSSPFGEMLEIKSKAMIFTS